MEQSVTLSIFQEDGLSALQYLCHNRYNEIFIEDQRDEASFFYAFIDTASTIMNQFENYRYRIRGNQVVLHEQIHPSFSDLSEDTDLFKMVTINLEGSIHTFSWKAKEKADKQTEHFVFEELEGRDDLI